MNSRRSQYERHGMSGSPTYSIWEGMIRRCYNAHYKKFYLYGGRGITVCERWRNSFLAFLGDMGERPVNLTIDRIDVNGNYEPDNCKWATYLEQAKDTRGDKNGARLHPETRARGDRSGMRLHPESVRRGECGNGAKLTEVQVAEIRRLRNNGMLLREIAGQFNIHLSNVSLIARGQHWKHSLPSQNKVSP